MFHIRTIILAEYLAENQRKKNSYAATACFKDQVMGASAGDYYDYTEGTTVDPTKFYTIEEVASFLNMSKRTVRRRIKDGSIGTVPLCGRLIRVSADELARLSIRTCCDKSE